ncbi:MAG: aspartate aminotransferase [Brevundimonas sp.]|uniref:pyridoxal phosphate-dependent aminotransferase n=1 Tax=Brevundimonas sp. TaxID=1871086 RepID=UPI000DB3CA16|nr:histidinol-phosphate transaminase [Brevundimonas sp.]PZU71537.1 MAG: aspartate aminotransferase [Brevundimonas sp.]
MRTTRRLVLGGGLTAGALAALPAAAQSPARSPSRLQLGLNENPWGPSPRVAPAVRAALGQVKRYVEDEAAAFERQVAAFEGVTPDQVVVGEVLAPLGLHLALAAGSASRFVHSAPGYAGFTDPAAAVGGRLDPVPLNARYENDLPALLARADGATALFVVNPHNPSGTVSDPAAFHDFLRQAARKTLVIVDEAYLEYAGDYAARTAAPLVAQGLNLVVFRTFAKVYGLAGLQLGYALAPADLAGRLKAKGVGAPHSLDRLALAAGGAALADQDHVRSVVRRTAVERDLYHAWLDRLGWPRTASKANFVFFRAPRSQVEIASVLRDQGVDIGRAHPPLTDWTRISLGLPEENRRVRAVLSA